MYIGLDEGLDEFASELPEGAKVAIEAQLKLLSHIQERKRAFKF